jgi:hypothetical protein
METKILLIDNQPELPSELAVLLFDSGYHLFNIADINDSDEIILNGHPEYLVVNNYDETYDLNLFAILKKLSSVNLKVIFSNKTKIDLVEDIKDFISKQ